MWKKDTSGYIATFVILLRALESYRSTLKLPVRLSPLASLGREEWTRYFRPQERIEAKEEAPVQPEALYSWFIGVSFWRHAGSYRQMTTRSVAMKPFSVIFACL